jgi:hypothetical protein
MATDNGPFRGELDAAYARIAELERKLENRDGAAALRKRLAQLKSERAYAANLAARPTYRRSLQMGTAASALVVTMQLTSLAQGGHYSWSVVTLVSSALVCVLSVWQLIRQPSPAVIDARIAAIQAELDALERETTGVRVDAVPRAPTATGSEDREDAPRFEVPVRRAG